MRFTLIRLLLVLASLVIALSLKAEDGWHSRVTVSLLFVTDSGFMRVGFNPSPNDSGFFCGSNAPIIQSAVHITDFHRSRWIEERMYETLSDALISGARVSVYLDERIDATGASSCYVQRVQIWPPEQNSSSGSGQTPEDTPWGAIAVSDEGNSYITWNYSSRSAARDAALNGCRNSGGTGCQIIDTMSGSGICHVFARSSNGAWGVGTGLLEEARSIALSSCRNANGVNCTVTNQGCNT